VVNRLGPSCLLILIAAGSPRAGEMMAPFDFQRVRYNHPGLAVDLGVGLWAMPLPMDYDGDGDNDLVVATHDVPYNGIYFFENTGGNVKFPVFKPAVRLGQAVRNMQVSFVGGKPWVLIPRCAYPDFRASVLKKPKHLHYRETFYTGRSNHWRLADYDGDGVNDLVIGASDWREYGWDNAFNPKGEWTRGPIHGELYVVRNAGSNDQPKYEEATKIEACGDPIDVFGMPSPNLADWDGDGDLDIVCGEFLDKLTYFENIGSRTKPAYDEGRFLRHDDHVLRMDLQMILPAAIDWDKDGDVDLVVGQEDGRVALIENTGKLVNGMPDFLLPRFFQQEADELKIGALATPVSFDWDGDGDEDILSGNTAGYIVFVENLDGGNPPKWAAPRTLEADGKVVRIQAGYNGSIQGPAEAKWGYTVLNAADWDHDGLPDLVVNSIWGKVVWFRNVGSRTSPKLAAAQPVEVEWPGPPPKPAWNWWTPQGKHLVTQWRTTPAVLDINGDGLNDLVMLDTEGTLAFFERRRAGDALQLLPGKHIFLGTNGKPLRLNGGRAGRSGRRKFCFADWDRDGRLDLLVNSRNVSFLRNVGTDGRFVFRSLGQTGVRQLAGHTTCPCTVDWNGDGAPDLLAGAEDGFLYYLENFAPAETAGPKPLPKPKGHLVAAWDFEQARGGPLADKATSGAVADPLKPLGKARVAKGIGIVPADQGSAFRADTSPDLEQTGELTIWVRLRVERSPDRFVSLVDKRHFRSPEERSYGFYIPPAFRGRESFTVGGQVSVDGTGKASVAYIKGDELIPTGQWREAAMVVARTRRGYLAVRWYASSTDQPKTADDFDLVGGPAANPIVCSIFRCRQPVLVGNDAGLKSIPTPLEIDEVRLYSRALSPENLAAIEPGELSPP